MTKESQAIIDTLLAEGWKEHPNCMCSERLLFAKTFPGYAKCKCNQPNDKQVEVYFNPEYRINRHVLPECFHVELVGQLPDNQWLRMQIENLASHDEIEMAVRQLLTEWDHVVKFTPQQESPE